MFVYSFIIITFAVHKYIKRYKNKGRRAKYAVFFLPIITKDLTTSGAVFEKSRNALLNVAYAPRKVVFLFNA